MTLRSNNSNNKPNGESIHRVAVVTGSSTGIGFETSLMLLLVMVILHMPQ